jgi:hypothetical protein
MSGHGPGKSPRACGARRRFPGAGPITGRRIFSRGALGCAAAVASLPVGAQPTTRTNPMAAPMEDVVYALDHHENGVMKTELHARRVDPGDVLRAQGVTLELFDEQGRVEGRLTAEECRVDTDQQRIWSENGRVRMERNGAVLEGRGFRLGMQDRMLKIFNDVRLTLPSATLPTLLPGGYGDGSREKEKK